MAIDQGMRVRFAPSPTGFLHVGGARTALFNWLLARHAGGVFILRIEDTDKERSSAPMTQAILDGLRWLGLDWDEGPFFQAAGLERHRHDAMRMLDTGTAYRCFCTPEQLEARRGSADGAFRYDRYCLRNVTPAAAERRAAAGELFTVRYRVPEGVTAWEDAVHGRIEFANSEIEDFIVLRSDGTPIYNMAVVSDDAAMRVTHVIRGDDHISNTPKQILLYQALGFVLPVFGHVPIILGPDGRKLSKRHGATALAEYRNQGILPDAMFNFLALLGWSPGTDEEVFTRVALIERFSLAGINRKSAIFDTRKLSWLNGQHSNRLSAEALAKPVLSLAPQSVREHAAGAEARARTLRLIDLLKVRARGLDDIAAQLARYLAADLAYDDDAVQKHWKQPEQVAARLGALRKQLAAAPAWTEAQLESLLRALADAQGVGAGQFIHPLRVALTGQAVSPGIFELAAALGQELTLARIDAAIGRLLAAAST